VLLENTNMSDVHAGAIQIVYHSILHKSLVHLICLHKPCALFKLKMPSNKFFAYTTSLPANENKGKSITYTLTIVELGRRQNQFRIIVD
jgi:hypothetical protein